MRLRGSFITQLPEKCDSLVRAFDGPESGNRKSYLVRADWSASGMVPVRRSGQQGFLPQLEHKHSMAHLVVAGNRPKVQQIMRYNDRHRLSNSESG